jgi:hypothetical protein
MVGSAPGSPAILKSQDAIVSDSSSTSTASPNNLIEDVSFVGKLAMMLHDPIALSYVSWSAGDDSIVIFDRLKFASLILPRSVFIIQERIFAISYFL